MPKLYKSDALALHSRIFDQSHPYPELIWPTMSECDTNLGEQTLLRLEVLVNVGEWGVEIVMLREAFWVLGARTSPTYASRINSRTARLFMNQPECGLVE